MIVIAELNLFANSRPLTWVLPEQVASKIPQWFPETRRSVGREIVRLYLPPPAESEVGYRGIFLTTFDDPSDADAQDEPVAGRRKTRTIVIPSPDARVVREIYESYPQQALLALTFEELVRRTSGPYPIAGLEGPALERPLECPSAPEFPVGAELDEWNSSLANCYGYANNKKAFCLPGQGALIDPTVRGVQALLRSYDQLRFVAMGDPSRPPRARRQAAYIAVCLRGPVGNQFSSLHCFRMDRSGAWSDKDGSFPVEDRATPTLHSIRTSPRLTLVGVFLSEEGRRQID